MKLLSCLASNACGLILLLSGLHSIAAGEAYLKGNFTGAEMLRYCKVASDDSVRDFERGICTGFIDGFAAGHHAAELWHAFHHRDESIENIYGQLCVPTDANRTALVAVFVRYLENHRDNLDWNAGLLLESALREAYPCPEGD
ncbi:MAG: hypothetical protein JSU95_18435 [Betaproteobacteria bacterium]|nr:MAG: hypothetical protein JSU95_18435 [Betaproteobacteria bacterium]